MYNLSTKYRVIITIAAALAVIFVLTASATIFLHNQDTTNTKESTVKKESTVNKEPDAPLESTNQTSPEVKKDLPVNTGEPKPEAWKSSTLPKTKTRTETASTRPYETNPEGPAKPTDQTRPEVSKDLAANKAPSEPATGESFNLSKADRKPEVPSSRTEDSTHTKRKHPPQRRELQASNTDDNEKWQEYLIYRNGPHPYRIHPFPVNTRTTLTLIQQDNLPVHDAPVTISVAGQQVFHGRTYADGTLMFFPEERPQDGFDVEIATTPTHLFKSLELPADMQNMFVLGNQPSRPEKQPLDVLFLIDSTGSMADEIHRIKATLLSIAESISNLPSQPDLRFAMVAYRDRGDDYVTRKFDFEPDPKKFLRTIRHLQAQAGGDYPESLNEALHVAVNDVQWREINTVRIIFLIADAPPHLDYQQDYSYAENMATAREKGIKIHAVATSGLDQQGEYIFRQIAQNTRGRFVFLLYPTGEHGKLTTPHQVGDNYQPEQLDNLIVRLVTRELAYLHPQPHDHDVNQTAIPDTPDQQRSEKTR